MLLVDTDPAWSTLSWSVTAVRSGLPMEQYRQLARVQNTRYSTLFYAAFTVPDVSFNLRIEYDQFSLNSVNVTAAMVARAYD